MEIFESHAHYDDEKFNEDRDEVIKSVYASNVTKIISAGYSLQGSKNSLELAKKYPYIYSTVGISPNDINENYKEEIKKIDLILSIIKRDKSISDDEFLKKLKQKYNSCNKNIQENLEQKYNSCNKNIQENLEQKYNSCNKNNQENLKQNLADTERIEYNIDRIFKLYKNYDSKKLVAIGEIGLDYHYDTNKEMQKDAFIKQIELANKFNFPIVIHTREAVMDTLQILKDHKVNRTGVFHCCPHNRELIKEGLKLGFYISFSGTCTFKNAHNAEECVKMVPNDKFLIETDSPYLAPEPVRGTRNDSRNLKYIIAKIAEFKGISEEEVAKYSYENTKKLYEILQN